MKIKSIPSTWLQTKGRRLDCGPYFSGGVEARLIVESLNVPKEPLCSLTEGGMVGIFHAGREARAYVTDPEHGVPFLSSSSFLRADISDLPLLSRKQVDKNPRFRIRQGWTLISRSGTIGRSVYARPDMDGLACSEHVMRVAPDPDRIPPGYLYAYLSSRYGLPQVMEGVFGAIIQSLSPEHIANLPVPRLGEKIERQVHDLVQRAANLRSGAQNEFLRIHQELYASLGFNGEDFRLAHPLSTQVPISQLGPCSRLEGFYYNTRATSLEKWLTHFGKQLVDLGSVAEVYDVPPFKHIYVEEGYGPPFFPSGELFLLERKAKKHLSRQRTKGLHKYIIRQHDVLLARSGSVGGIIGTLSYADRALDRASTSDHVIRIRHRSDDVPPGYLFAYLSLKEIGYQLLIRGAAGKAVPALWPVYVEKVPVVLLPKHTMQDLHDRVCKLFEMRAEATVLEDQARELVESTIESLGAD